MRDGAVVPLTLPRANATLAAPMDQVPVGPIELLIIQATPFCNINCRYCYLPDRANTARISLDTLATLMRRILEAPFPLTDVIPVSWHAGEPTSVPIDFYTRAFETMREVVAHRADIAHSMQTNGTLLDDRWLDFIQQHQIRLGLSLDGPDFLHDRSRVYRSGKGTHQVVMKAVEHLRERSIPFSVIAVVTSETLRFADSFYDFFRDHGISRVAMNVEEVELDHVSSSMNGQTSGPYYAFLSKLFERSLRDGSVQFRELGGVRGMVASDRNMPHRFGQLTRPFGVVSCDYRGDISSFSPELLGAKSEPYANFIMGNVHRDDFDAMLRSRAMQRMLRDIQAGIDKCQATCKYFLLCGGGTPANKLFENGTFDSTETMYCKHSRMAVIDAALNQLECHVFSRDGA